MVRKLLAVSLAIIAEISYAINNANEKIIDDKKSIGIKMKMERENLSQQLKMPRYQTGMSLSFNKGY
jgi:2C-methyl-D-erythritol 2,4-cyclodiphosphate synthase